MSKISFTLLALVTCFCTCGFAHAGVEDGPIPVEVVQTKSGGWQLLRGGEPYYVKGGCRGGELLDELAAAGGNSFRLWAAGPETMGLLDAAEERGLTVMLGLWMLHPSGHQDSGEIGFDYTNAAAVQDQLEQMALKVDIYKNHPALLGWGVGNELEHLNGPTDNGDQEAIEQIWMAIEQAAQMIKEKDPYHPTFCVTADMGGWHPVDNCTRITEWCPSIDIWGINAYETLIQIADEVDACVWDRPYMITEFGPMGWWGGPRTTWGSPIEHSNAQKANWFLSGWQMSIEANSDRCLGGYAFVWDTISSPTDTWWTIFTETGQPTECVDALTYAWTGSYPENRSPNVLGIDGIGTGIFSPGEIMNAELIASDPENGELTVRWYLGKEIFNDAGEYGGMASGCTEIDGNDLTLAVAAPTAPGTYRLVGIAEDDDGRAGLASISILVDGEFPNGQVAMPFAIDEYFTPTGWMGASWALSNEGIESPLGVCGGIGHKFTWSPPPSNTWTGVLWQYPGNNWGSDPGLNIMPGGTSVKCLAWSVGEVEVDFVVGNQSADGFERTLGDVLLTPEPQEIVIPLDGVEYTDVAIGFGWVMSQTASTAGVKEIYISDIIWDGPPPPPPCPADFNNDRVVNSNDLGLLLVDFYSIGDTEFDLNNDTSVDGNDIAVLFSQWGACPE